MITYFIRHLGEGWGGGKATDLRQSRTVKRVITVKASLRVLTQISVIWKRLKNRAEKLFSFCLKTDGNMGTLLKSQTGETASRASVDEFESLNN